jgi:hypothetical protein
MSKHTSADDKLHTNPARRAKLPVQKTSTRSTFKVPRPPTGTNARNQFR